MKSVSIPPRSASSGTFSRWSGPSTKSTKGARCKSFDFSCCATHPATPIFVPRRAFSSRYRPSAEKSLSSAFSRIAQVFTTIRSAPSGASVAAHPARARASPMRCESDSFIWQPKVWM